MLVSLYKFPQVGGTQGGSNQRGARNVPFDGIQLMPFPLGARVRS